MKFQIVSILCLIINELDITSRIATVKIKRNTESRRHSDDREDVQRWKINSLATCRRLVNTHVSRQRDDFNDMYAKHQHSNYKQLSEKSTVLKATRLNKDAMESVNGQMRCGDHTILLIDTE